MLWEIIRIVEIGTKENATMATMNTNTVYDNKTDRVIAIGTLTEIKDYRKSW